MLRVGKRRAIPKEHRIKHWKIVKGDEVMVRWGKDKGKIGKVTKVIRCQNRVVVEGVNLRERRIKKGMQEELIKELQGNTQNKTYITESPIPVSKVALLDPIHKKPTKVKWSFVEKNGKFKKVRVSKLSGAIIPKPAYIPNRPWKQIQGPKDTPPDVVLLKTFDENTLNPLKLAAYQHKEISLSIANETAAAAQK